LLGVFVFCCQRKCRRSSPSSFWHNGADGSDLRQRVYEKKSRILPFSIVSIDCRDAWEIQSENLIVDYGKKLGSGAFAHVYKGILGGQMPLVAIRGQLNFATDADQCNEVAVKMLVNADDDNKRQAL
jgi:hypothetical protein